MAKKAGPGTSNAAFTTLPDLNEEVIHRSELATLKLAHGIPVHYARFHSPVPPCKRLEPVSEFRVKTTEKRVPLSEKYYVDSLLWIPGKCLLWTYNDEEYAVESANIMYTRITP